MSEFKKLIIIGGGPAGLSAAVYAARAGLKPLVFAGSPPGGQLMLTSDVENFPGFPSVLGSELISSLRKQAISFGVDIKDQNVLEITQKKSPFEIRTTESIYHAQALIIATGAQALWLELESERRLRGKGVSACATCDGFFFKNKIVAVVGGGDTAMEEAHTLTKFAKKVYVIHRKDYFRASRIMQEKVKNHPSVELVLNNEILEIIGNERVTGIRLKKQYNNNDFIDLDGVFIAIGHKPDTNIVSFLERDERGYLYTTQTYALSCLLKKEINQNKSTFLFDYPTSTSIPGIFGAGDCVDFLYRQAGTAAGMGIASSLDVERWLSANQP